MIHVLGSINIDYAVRLDQLPKPGETVAAQDLTLTQGGKGANQALAAKLAGSEVHMIGAIGSDNIADTAVALLENNGVNLSQVVRQPGPTGCAFVFVDKDSENQIVIIAGANGLVTSEQADKIEFDTSDVLLVQLECPTDAVITAAKRAKQKGSTVIANLAPYQSLDSSAFEYIDYLIVNESEAKKLCSDLNIPTGDNNTISIAKKTACGVVKTLGEKGLVATDNQGHNFSLPGIEAEAIDTVGAGDTFAGFLGAMLEKGASLQNACKVANAAASLACTRAGAQTSIPTLQDVIELANRAG